jgi:hypothetical protein
MRHLTLVLLAALAAACTTSKAPEGHAARPRPRAVTYSSIPGGAHASKRPVGLCELVRILDGGGGLYKVVRLKGVEEAGGVTDVELERVEAWTPDAPERPIARIQGGPAGGGVTRAWELSLRVGETLGVLFYAPREENRGRWGIDSLGVFQPDERGHVTNGQLFRERPYDLGEIGRLVRADAESHGACPHERAPYADMAAARAAPPPEPRVEKPSRVVLEKAD